MKDLHRFFSEGNDNLLGLGLRNAFLKRVLDYVDMRMIVEMQVVTMKVKLEECVSKDWVVVVGVYNEDM